MMIEIILFIDCSFDHFARVAGCDAIGWDGFRNYTSTSDDASGTYRYPFQYDASGTNQNIIFNGNGCAGSSEVVYGISILVDVFVSSYFVVQMMCIRIQNDTVSPYQHMIPDINFFFGPYACRAYAA